MPYGIVQADQLQTSVTGGTLGPGNATGMKNRIINGSMVLDQRNAGASVTPANGAYTLDRWCTNLTQASKLTVQQNAGSVTPPAGFSNYLGATSSSAFSIGSTDFFDIFQPIEGFNFADMAWGTANAKTITISFQARSSLTGTFSGYLLNASANRCYNFTYSIPVANTWTSISVTVAGDTTGTWTGATNGVGIYIVPVSLGAGSGVTTSTTNTWGGTLYRGVTGQTNLVATNGATFYITGVQLEVGSSATGFEFRDYGRELILCQRYLPCFNLSSNNTGSYTGQAFSTTNAMFNIIFPVQTRTAPTGISVTGTFNASTAAYGNGGNFSSLTFFNASLYSSSIQANGGSGLVAGNATQLLSPAGTSQIQFTGCEL